MRMEIESAARSFLARQRVAHLAFTEADDQPQLLAVCFAVGPDAVYALLDDEADLTREPVVDAIERRAVVVLCDESADDPARHAWVSVRGRALVLRSGEEHEWGLTLLRDRYPQYRAHTLSTLPVLRVEPTDVRSRGLRADPVAESADDAGLNLVRTMQRIPASHVTTEYRAGLSTGMLMRLRYAPEGARRSPTESQDEAAMPDEGGRMLRFNLADLEDGIYAAESIGAANIARTTYFEVEGGRVGRVFDGERRALQELRRRER